MERKNSTTLCVRVIAVRESRFGSSRFVDEGQGVDRRLQPVGQTVDVLAALPLDLYERVALGLCFNHADCMTVNEQQVVDSAMALLEHKLSDGYAWTVREVGMIAVLDQPASCDQL